MTDMEDLGTNAAPRRFRCRVEVASVMAGDTRSPRFKSKLTSLYARKTQAIEAAMKDVSLQVMLHMENPNEDAIFIVN